MAGVVAMGYGAGTMKSPRVMPRTAAKSQNAFLPGQRPVLSLPKGSWLLPTIAMGALGWVMILKVVLF
jgi:hypothetical protein